MTALLALVLAAALPEGAARWRAELGGEPIGFAALAVRCGAGSCAAVHEVELRLPAEAGGGVRALRVEVEVDRAGRWRGAPLRVVRDGVESGGAGRAGGVPSSLAELLLSAAGRGESCLELFDEEAPGDAPRRACGRRVAGWVEADVGGTPVVIVPGDDGFPAEMLVAGRMRFVRDARAVLPERPPALAGVRVAGPSDPAAARRFCGVPPDSAASVALPPGLPPPSAPGASCREKTAAWLEAAARAGAEARTAVGLRWDGAAFAWHAWAEVRAGPTWIPVDPTFREAPARGTRFTIGRYAAGDRAARDAAGRRILACWGSSRVE